ncbi:protein of unknown function [Methylocaldum szegediense]|uniref:Transposase n=1 Tax=Methylocaldum szegediense TaxID=73780 RepID=A0ABN8X3Y8_9GAMM|nr:protein of unknown function [Methylocaldum szegediense]
MEKVSEGLARKHNRLNCWLTRRGLISVIGTFRSLASWIIEHLVRMERLELSRVAPLEPKSSASTNFATFAHERYLDYTPFVADLPAGPGLPSRYDPKTDDSVGNNFSYYKTRDFFFICSFFGQFKGSLFALSAQLLLWVHAPKAVNRE